MAKTVVLSGTRPDAVSAARAKLQSALEQEGFCVRICDSAPSPSDAPDDDRTVLLLERGVPGEAERDWYDGVFVLTDGADNPDAPIPAAWVGHPHLRVLDRSDTLPARLLAEVNALLGYPEPVEIERRFLIRRPSDGQLLSLPACRTVPIRQTYCIRADGSRFRLRQRGSGAQASYTLNEKERVSDRTRIERERQMSRDEYTALLAFADPARRPVVKERTCLLWRGTYYEIDRFPFWQKQAILEVELLTEDQPVALPPWVEVLREVTADRRYNNSALAREIPNEE